MTTGRRFDRRGRLLLASLLLTVSACGGHEEPRGEDAGAASSGTLDAPTARVERLELPEEREIYGTVEAERSATLSARVMAMVTALHVRAGDSVRQGDLLLEIDPQAARGQLAQASGALGQARGALALAERNYQRFQALAARDAASELELDMARMQYEQALGAVEQAEGAVDAAASVADDSRVVAPFAGRIVRTLVERGDLAAPGRPLVTLESQGAHRLVLTVPESLMFAAGLEIGDSLRTRIDTRPELEPLEGTVVEVSPVADPLSHSFQIELELPVTGLASGLTGRAWIPGKTHTVITVPADAVLRQGGLAMVVLRSEDGRATSRVVTLGATRQQGIEVLSGLSGGEEIVLGLAAVPPTGTRVEPSS